MADTTDVLALPYPEGADANDVPADMQALAERVDEVPGIESLTSAEIAALTSAQKPAGRVVWNSTTSKLQVSNGTTFTNIDAASLLLTGGTMTGAIAMSSNKITGLAAATANGDAVRFEQPLMKTGGTMSGAIAMGSQQITGLANGTATGDAVNKGQLDAAVTLPYVRGVRSSAQAFSNGDAGRITFTSESGTLTASLDTAAGTFTIPTSGIWAFSAYVKWASTLSDVSTPYENEVYIRNNTTSEKYMSMGDALSHVSLGCTVFASAGDVIDLVAYQASGTSRDITVANFYAVRMGSA